MAGEALPDKYKAAVYDQPGKISTKIVEKPMPEPAAGDVLIKLYAHPERYASSAVSPPISSPLGLAPRLTQVLCLSTHSGVCHSDLGIMMNSWRQMPFPTDQGQVCRGPIQRVESPRTES